MQAYAKLTLAAPPALRTLVGDRPVRYVRDMSGSHAKLFDFGDGRERYLYPNEFTWWHPCPRRCK